MELIEPIHSIWSGYPSGVAGVTDVLPYGGKLLRAILERRVVVIIPRMGRAKDKRSLVSSASSASFVKESLIGWRLDNATKWPLFSTIPSHSTASLLLLQYYFHYYFHYYFQYYLNIISILCRVNIFSLSTMFDIIDVVTLLLMVFHGYYFFHGS